MKTTGFIAALLAVSFVAGCSEDTDLGCVGATAGGAILGGVVGNQIGSGTGNDIATAGGAVAGGLAANNAAC
ncbi:MAG: glycine zipper 2TM domain-containing protein [Pseudomonadota bacterium]